MPMFFTCDFCLYLIVFERGKADRAVCIENLPVTASNERFVT